ncbi:MAG TPA: DUF438 domain-containing protein [Bacilli bacterium]|nr:DUF438 domain-containing protein [Bacilli bacterium]
MSELINNRQEKLKKLILSLHAGKDFEVAKQEFKEDFGSITTEEISQLEQGLIKDGMDVADIQKLCDVHAAVFDGSISDIHKIHDYSSTPGHPVQVFIEENEKIEQLIKEEVEPYLTQTGKTALLMLRVAFDRLKEIDKHYARKEYLCFPHLEKKGITAPPKVMWGVDDEIRADIKEVIALLGAATSDEREIHQKVKAVITRVRDMISKENNILLPLLKESLSFYNWISVDSASEEIGWFLGRPKHSWKKVENESVLPVEESGIKDGEVGFDAGSLSVEQLNAMLNTLPFDLTFVDAEGHVKYFTQGKERIFARPATIIGRHVSMCHPPQSVHVVEDIIESFRSGKKDHEDFWIKFRGSFVYIRYFAVRDKQGTYLGTLEITQNIQPIRELEGEKRLAS